MAIPCAVLMCHAPIAIPALGQERAGACARTTAAMARTAAQLVAHAPDVLVLISPHTPRRREGFGIAVDAQLSGDFSRFGRGDLRLRAPGAPQAAQALQRCAHARGLGTFAARGVDLDHGAGGGAGAPLRHREKLGPRFGARQLRLGQDGRGAIVVSFVESEPAALE